MKMSMFNDLLDRLRNKEKITPEEAAKRKARQDAITRYSSDSVRYMQYVTGRIHKISPGNLAKAPVLQDYLNDPKYVWSLDEPAPPRPI